MQASPTDQIRVLGPLDIVRASGTVTVSAQKERQLLVALLVAAGETRSSDALVDALWGAAPPRSAARLLHVYVSKLRKALPDSVRIRTHGSGYSLELADGVLDAARFERLLAEGREAARAGNPALAVSLLRRALGLWRGPAYGELAYETFARVEAERLEELRLVALEERFEAELELERDLDLLPELQSLANAHPLRERLQAQMMLALYRLGRQAEALDRYAATRRHLDDELGLEPGVELRELQRRILQHDPQLAAAPGATEVVSSSFPMPPNQLLGRERELAELGQLIRRDEVRLLVLTGAGGSGKTRLAIEAARQAALSFANGAVFVELAPVHDPDLLLSAIAGALGVDQAGSDPLETVVATLRGRELLLLLDNFEHLRTAAPVLGILASRAPRLTLLVTSRVVLHLSGEHVYPVEPLDEETAVTLFIERARRADAHFDPASAERAIQRICERLDGLPLAIELAAGRVRARTPAELLAGLDQHVPLLTGGPRDLPARQRTLRATLEWSVDLLDDLERGDLMRLSVFPGRFPLESAEAVSGTTLERLSSLVDHNLLVRRVTPQGSLYSMLETIRQFAAEQLEDSGETDAVHRRHAERMIAIAQAAHVSEEADEPFVWPAGQAEPEDLRAALDWATERDVLLGLELACAYENFWGPHAPAEGARRVGDLLAGAVDVEVPPKLRARALRNLAGAAHQERDYEVAEPAYAESLRIFTELGDARGAASVQMRLAYCAFSHGERALARALLDEALHTGKGRFAFLDVQGAILLTHIALLEDRLDEAESSVQRSAELAAALGWKWQIAVVHVLRLTVCLRRGDLDEAERVGRAALAINVEEQHAAPTMITSVAGLAQVAFVRGDLERAGLLWGSVLQHGERQLGFQSALWWEASRNEMRPAFLEALARGRELELSDAAAIALAAASQ